MKPSETSQELRRIAAAIDNSNRPDPRLVAADIKRLISRLANPQPEVAQQEQVALPGSVGKKMLQEQLQAALEALGKGDDGAFKKALENVNRAAK